MSKPTSCFYLSQECGYVRQYHYSTSPEDMIVLRSALYQSSGISNKCPVNLVKKTEHGCFVEVTDAHHLLIENDSLSLLYHSNGGGMYNGIMNHDRLSRAYKTMQKNADIHFTTECACILPKDQHSDWIEAHKASDVIFHLIDGKPREAHIIHCNKALFQKFIRNHVSSTMEYSGKDSRIHSAITMLKDCGVTYSELQSLFLINIHDRTPSISEPLHTFKQPKRSVIIINNMPPKSALDSFSLSANAPSIDFRIGSNQLHDLKKELEASDTPFNSPVSDLMSLSECVYMNAIELRSLFSDKCRLVADVSSLESMATSLFQALNLNQFIVTNEQNPLIICTKETTFQYPLSNTALSIISNDHTPTGCGDMFASAFLFSSFVSECSSLEKQLQFSIFWAHIVLQIKDSSLKDLRDKQMHDLMTQIFAHLKNKK